MPQRVSLADLADGALTGTDPAGTELDEAGRPTDPLWALDLHGDLPDRTLRQAVAQVRERDRLLVGIASGPLPARHAELVESLDVTLIAGPSGSGADTCPEDGTDRRCVVVPDPEEEYEALNRSVATNPQAALVLAQVLRAAEGLPVGAALDVESFAYSTLLGGAEFHAWLDGRGARPQPPRAAEPVLVRRDGDRLSVTLNRPERRNAYGRELRDTLTDALRLAVLDPGIAGVVLDGAGPCFCSGGDLDEFGTAPDLTVAHFVRTRAGAGRLVHQLGGRIEVRVHGACVGAGIEIPAFAGTVVAAPGTTFRLPEVGMGLIPGAGGTVSVPRRIGRWRTFHLAVTGRPLPVSTALAWGLIDRVDPVPFRL